MGERGPTHTPHTSMPPTSSAPPRTAAPVQPAAVCPTHSRPPPRHAHLHATVASATTNTAATQALLQRIVAQLSRKLWTSFLRTPCAADGQLTPSPELSRRGAATSPRQPWRVQHGHHRCVLSGRSSMTAVRVPPPGARARARHAWRAAGRRSNVQRSQRIQLIHCHSTTVRGLGWPRGVPYESPPSGVISVISGFPRTYFSTKTPGRSSSSSVWSKRRTGACS